MAQWMFLNELEKARSLFLDAYFARYENQSPKVGPTQWDDVNWLDHETERLVLAQFGVGRIVSEEYANEPRTCH